jgi:4-amino-4-deoxy-L-arabinose transferase-like glycosyltransferase
VPTLWDVDEPHNVECSREMDSAGNWIVPTFNFRLRTDKPALLYWLQIAAFRVFGVNEFSGRLPCALAVLGTALTLYFLGRSMFGEVSAFLAALTLAISPGVVGAAHFANPDALLLLCTTAALTLFWNVSKGKGSYFAVGVWCGLGVLAKGPVGFLLPAAIGLFFLVWTRRWGVLLSPRVGLLILGVVLVAAPWYALVAAETKGVWVREFWTKHHSSRMLSAMEGHGGPFFYYLLVLIPGLLPWSVFLAPACWHSWTRRTDTADGDAMKYLTCWASVLVVFFSLSQTKLPNYVLPAYPALAMMIGHFLHRWQAGEAVIPTWVEHAGLSMLGLAGVLFAVALLIVGGVFPIEKVRPIPGISTCASLGLILIGGAAFAAWQLIRRRRSLATASVMAAAAVFAALAAAWLLPALNDAKPARHLADALPASHRQDEIRLAACRWWQPSLVFYAGREVAQLDGPREVAEFLAQGLPAYAFLLEADLEELRQYPVPVRVLTRRGDLYRGKTVVLVTNR